MIGWLLRLLGRKRMPPALGGGQWGGTGYIDSYRVLRNPSANELMAELKGTAWTCASINASVCAAFPPRLYVTTARGQARPKCATVPVSKALEQRLRSTASPRIRSADYIEEVAEHPLLDLLRQVNPVHNALKLWTNYFPGIVYDGL